MSLFTGVMTMRLVTATLQGVVVIDDGIGVFSELLRRNCSNVVVQVLLTSKKKKKNTIIE